MQNLDEARPTLRETTDRPKKRAITGERKRFLAEEAPDGEGRTWATVIAEAMPKQATKGDVRAIPELANCIEGKPYKRSQWRRRGGSRRDNRSKAWLPTGNNLS